MARKPRMHYKGALYHVIARGNNKEYVLDKDEDKQFYIDTIKRYKEKFDFRLYAYCIMDNHIHMLIQVMEIPLAKIMQGIQLVYTQKYNKKYKRTGHVFEQRYKAIPCNMDGYLLHLTKYIHLNPIEAGITEDVKYKWSSYNEYRKGNNGFIDVNFVLKMLMANKSKAIKAYREYMTEEMDDIEKEEFEIKEQPVTDRVKKEVKRDLAELINEVIKSRKLSKKEVILKTKLRKITDARKEIIERSLKECEVTQVELSRELGISIAAVSKTINKLKS